MPTSKASLSVSEEIGRGPRPISGERRRTSFPAISKCREIFDFHEVGVDGAELVPNAFDRGSDVCSIPIFAAPRDKAAMVDAIIDRAITDMVAGIVDQPADDVEFGDRQIDVGAFPIGAAQAR